LGIKEEGNVIINNGSDAQKDSLLNTVWTIMDRIKTYPDVKYASLAFDAIPYSGNYRNNSFTIDSVAEYIQIKTVAPDFFYVFDINILQGNIPEWNNPDDIVISGTRDNMFLKKDVRQIKTLDFEGEKKKVIGAVESSKRSEFNNSDPIIYILLPRNNVEAINMEGYSQICVRVKAEADKNFIERFTKDMQNQIAVDPYFLSSVTSIDDIRKDYIKWTGYDSNFKSIFSISAFLLINIFLAVVGTFWFRTQTRRSEIGLRIALGSSRVNVQTIFIIETILLIFFASIIATIISVNVALADVLKDIGIPVVERGEDEIRLGQYLINYCITFFILVTISIIAVWYPSRKASNIQPAEALKDE
jgi:putative ABC transport system permease protein